MLNKNSQHEDHKRIDLDDLDVYQKSWKYGMQKIAEQILANEYGVDPEQLAITTADLKHLIFKGYNIMDWNKKFTLQLKIAHKLTEKIKEK